MEEKLDQIIELLKEIRDRLPEKETDPFYDNLTPEQIKKLNEMLGFDDDGEDHE